MPQDTTIYWDGYGKTPELIAELPADIRATVMEKINARREELRSGDPTFTYIFIAAVFLFFFAAALYTRKKMKLPKKENAGSTGSQNG